MWFGKKWQIIAHRRAMWRHALSVQLKNWQAIPNGRSTGPTHCVKTDLPVASPCWPQGAQSLSQPMMMWWSKSMNWKPSLRNAMHGGGHKTTRSAQGSPAIRQYGQYFGAGEYSGGPPDPKYKPTVLGGHIHRLDIGVVAQKINSN